MTLPTVETHTYDNLFAGSNQLPISDPDAVLDVGQNQPKGALLGKITKTPGTVDYDVGNTGDGTVSAYTLGANAQLGDYILTCTAAAANSGTFSVTAPDGTVLPDATVAVAYSGQINFTIGDGAADWVVGDIITLTVDAGSGNYILSLAAAVDGSQHPSAVLAEAVDASAAATPAPVYIAGEFNQNALTYGTGHSAASVKAALQDKNIYLKDAVAA